MKHYKVVYCLLEKIYRQQLKIMTYQDHDRSQHSRPYVLSVKAKSKDKIWPKVRHHYDNDEVEAAQESETGAAATWWLAWQVGPRHTVARGADNEQHRYVFVLSRVVISLLKPFIRSNGTLEWVSAVHAPPWQVLPDTFSCIFTDIEHPHPSVKYCKHEENVINIRLQDMLAYKSDFIETSTQQ